MTQQEYSNSIISKCCDLHTHSIYSDGTLTPPEIIDEAVKSNLSAVALCDHNTIWGLPEFVNAAKGKNIEAVGGIEFTTEHNKTELHILALFVSPNAYDEITQLLNNSRRLKEESNIKLVNKLCDIGLKIDYLQIKNNTPNGQVNRANIAAELLNKGYVDSVDEAFKKYLSPKQGLYVPSERLSSLDIIKFIKSIGAVSVWAHPFLNMTPTEIENFLPIAKDCGLNGMETRYSLYDDKTEKLAVSYAKRFGLSESGGSDFHGMNKPDISLGTGKGNLFVPYDFYLKLKEKHEKIKT